MSKASQTRLSREKRHLRVRKKISGTCDRPRLCVFRSSNHIYAQIIDDSKGNTLFSASTVEVNVKNQTEGKNKLTLSQIVGTIIGKKATENGISQVIFDRGGYRYHGRVKALADAAREAGLKF